MIVFWGGGFLESFMSLCVCVFVFWVVVVWCGHPPVGFVCLVCACVRVGSYSRALCMVVWSVVGAFLALFL